MAVGQRRMGVLTGGGDCPGLNAVIRAVVKSALRDGWSVHGFEDSTDGMLRGGRHHELTDNDVSGILDRGGTILGTSNSSNPFAYPIRDAAGQRRVVDRSAEVVETARAMNLDAVIAIGGDGTQSMSHRFAQRGLPMIGVPKTIDNDIAATDLSFGYNTAVGVATEALDRLHTTAEAHRRVMILEVMGRHAGWIALSAGIAGGADVILIPEIPYMLARILQKIEQRTQAGKRFSLIVVAEGAYPQGGRVVRQEDHGDGRGARLGGIGHVLRRQLSGHVDAEARVTVLGHLQRGGSPCPFDRVLATRFGTAAVTLANSGRFGRMVALRGDEIVDVALAEAVGRPKRVPVDGDLVRTARATGVSFGD
ncbi:MAG: ATP-dependent 6-phosphofructokinase [Chloroflexota bacterium]